MYVLTDSGVKRLTDNAQIPADAGNRCWQRYLEWVEAGNTPLAIKPAAYYVIVDDAWVIDLTMLKASKTTELKLDCEAECRAGCVSDKLGAPHVYETATDRDQANLIALTSAAMKNKDTLDWTQNVTCFDADGIKARRSHTAAQLAGVGEDAQLMISGNVDKLWSKLADLDAAFKLADQDAMLAVGW